MCGREEKAGIRVRFPVLRIVIAVGAWIMWKARMQNPPGGSLAARLGICGDHDRDNMRHLGR
jgi:hypothetical protein